MNEPTAYEILPDLCEAIRHFGHVKTNECLWLAKYVAQFWHSNTERDILRIGTLMNTKELAEAGYPRWLKFGKESYEVLTPAGRLLAENAFKSTISRAKGRYYQAKEFRRLRRDLAMQIPFRSAYLIFAPAYQQCEAIRVFKDFRFETAQSLRHIPLPECDQDICGCRYMGEL